VKPPFRVEHVGSFVRPERLIQAARERFMTLKKSMFSVMSAAGIDASARSFSGKFFL